MSRPFALWGSCRCGAAAVGVQRAGGLPSLRATPPVVSAACLPQPLARISVGTGAVHGVRRTFGKPMWCNVVQDSAL